jgi:glycolate oxidase FAD binding subunit
MTEAVSTRALEALQVVVGDYAHALDPVESAAGCSLIGRIEPANGEELADCLRVFSTHGEPALVMGAGTRLGFGNSARGVSLALSCRRMTGIEELDAADGVVHVLAGTPLAELASQVEAEGWLLPLDPPDRGGTLGGVLGTAECGPRQRGFGPVRDAVLGLDTALASGERTRCGARVVKNVTGYDLSKLYVGSMGTLGVIEKAWLRLKPIPASVRVVEVAVADSEEPFSLAVETARRSSARAVAVVSGPARAAGEKSDGFTLVAEFAGERPATEADADWLAGGRAASLQDPARLDALREQQGQRTPDGLHARIHLLPRSLAATCTRLKDQGAGLLVYPEPSVVHASFRGRDGAGGRPDEWEPTLGMLGEISRMAGAEIVLTGLPESLRPGPDVFMGASELKLMRSIKQRFDPDGILNPGRFAGRI